MDHKKLTEKLVHEQDMLEWGYSCSLYHTRH